MKSILITGGTVFVSRYMAEYFVARGWRVFVLNRNTRVQSPGTELIEADRHHLGERLRPYAFDAVIDTAYTAADVDTLMDALGSFGAYVLISSSAVYPESTPQPFTEDARLGENRYWGQYGLDKIAAEQAARRRCPDAYILRPPYLYGPMNNVYREAFVFDCALQGRPFYLPGSGDMPLQFLHVEDLCRFAELLLDKRPQGHVYNIGNRETLSIRQWAEMCYAAAGKVPTWKNVAAEVEQRCYFCFCNYAYQLDVSRQHALMPEEKDMKQGLREALTWYLAHDDQVQKRPYLAYIDTNLVK